MKKLIAALLLGLSSCTYEYQAYHVEAIREVCEPHGGLHHFEARNIDHIRVYCNDGTNVLVPKEFER